MTRLIMTTPVQLMWLLILLAYCLALAEPRPEKDHRKSKQQQAQFAFVTLVTGGADTGGYVTGALALGQSLIDAHQSSNLRFDRVAMVTEDVDAASIKSLKRAWSKVVTVKSYYCHHKSSLDPSTHDLQSERYLSGIKRWSRTCTKFAAWGLTDYARVLFLDADTLVIHPIDEIFQSTNASFAAAPEVFPPDTFNSGVMLLTPSLQTLDRLEVLNQEIGSAEGGDQGVFNNGLCPNWFSVSQNDPDCGRLPWRFNVEAAHYESYKTLRQISKSSPPAVVHFVSDGKPWKVLMFEYMEVDPEHQSASSMYELSRQAEVHLRWRHAFFKATGETPPSNAFLFALVENNGVIPTKKLKDSKRVSKEMPTGAQKSKSSGNDQDNKGVATVSECPNKRKVKVKVYRSKARL